MNMPASLDVPWQLILDALPAQVALLDQQGRIVAVNRAWRRFDAENAPSAALCGVGEHYLGVCDRSRDKADEADVASLGIRSVLAGVSPHFALEYPCHSPGKERWFRMMAVPLDADAAHGCVVMHLDITERHAADAQLASLQQLHHNILDSVAEGIFGIDLQGRITFANPASESILGWREAEVVGRHRHTLVHQAYSDGRHYQTEECPILRTLLDGAARRVDDEVFLHREGQAIPVEYVVSPVRAPGGEVRGAVMCFRDNSQGLADQAALADREERFLLAARATASAVWDWDVATDTVIWSGGLESLFGVDDDVLRLQLDFWSERIHPDDRDRVIASLERAQAGDQDKWGEEYRFRRPDGSYAAVVDSGFVMRDAQRKAVRMVGGMTDVSRMRALEAQLRASQRLEAVGRLTGGLAHDFNNLLTVVLGNAEILQERLPGASLEHDLADMIFAAAQRGSNLTQRLLAFARRQALDARPVRLGELVRGMEHVLRRALGEHIELTLHAGCNGWVLVDAAQVENALLNLCINARDAMPTRGKLSITVSVASLAPPDVDPLSCSTPGDYVRLEVRDTGTGIAEDVLPLVIEPFFTTKDTGKGTGLGLSMVYGLVKQSNGYMDIRSQPGRGTCVRIHLPQVPEPVSDDRAPAGPVGTADAPEVPGGQEHLLLVEDDALVRRYASTQLQKLGYTVSEADEGMQALRLLKSDPSIALMLTDVMMPGLNGAQLADAARRIRPGLPVLFVSGYSQDALNSEGRLPEGVLLLIKPYPKVELARRVRQALA